MAEKPKEPEQDSVTRTERGRPDRVGKSVRPGGESEKAREPEPGREDAAPQGPTGRPSGTSTARDSTGIDPQEPIDPRSPNLR